MSDSKEKLKKKKTYKFFWFVGRKFLMHNLSMVRLQVWLAWPIYVYIFYLWSGSKFDRPGISFVYFIYGLAPSLIDLTYLYIVYQWFGSQLWLFWPIYMYFIYGPGYKCDWPLIYLSFIYVPAPKFYCPGYLFIIYLWFGSMFDWPGLSIYNLSIVRLQICYIWLSMYILSMVRLQVCAPP